MSFQGDVGGIGLADLLQSLARGRDGVLSLMGKQGLNATLGFQDGQLHLLPHPEEDPEIWRARVRSAWVKDADSRIDSLRMVEIARANRIEMLYRLLDSEGVHFRFNPGALPERPTESAISQGESGQERVGVRRDAVYVQSMSVEGLLLEYARLKDEDSTCGVVWPNSEDAVLVSLGANPSSKEVARFLNECDGESSLTEVADRLAMPLRQVRLTAIAELQKGTVRLAGHEELLVMAQQEMAFGMPGRAGSRVRAWLVCAPFGPMPTEAAQGLQQGWSGGALQLVLRELSTPDLRVFLRRLDCALGSPLYALEHWGEVAKVRREDRITQVRLVHLQAIASPDPNVPAMRDLLAMARAFLDAKRKFAAAAVLNIAAARSPDSTNVKLELGTLMLDANLGLDAGPWILEAAATLLEEDNAEKALPALRDYVAIDPGNREARRLLARARTTTVRHTLVKRNSLIVAAVLLALAVGAVVQFRSQKKFDQKLETVNAHLDDPHEALRLLESMFQADDGRVAELRRTLIEKRRIVDQAGRTAWMDRYREAQIECTLGDPVLGLRRTFEMPPPPTFGEEEEPLPLLNDLFNSLAARIEGLFVELGDKIDEAPAQLKAEARLSMLMEELQDVLSSASARPEAAEFKKRIDAFVTRLKERVETRRTERAARAKKDNLAQQDMLIGAARAHASAGDYERSLQLFKDLLAKDDTGKLANLLTTEMNAVREKGQAVARSLELSRAGRQAEAYEMLKRVLGDEAALQRELPWKVESFPTGARVKLADGTERVTPFTVQSSWEERVELVIEHAGHEPVKCLVEHPADQLVQLSRVPDRAWKPGGRIEALPVKVGEDHVVCDRDGHIGRLAKGSTLAWNHDLRSLGGVAHSPVFLSQVPGRLLVCTEDGDAWIVDANTGALEGPWSYGKPLVSGPEIVGDAARARFRDGAEFEWTNRLKPEAVTSPSSAGTSDPLQEGGDSSTTAGLAVLRRRSSSSTVLKSPWAELEVEVGAKMITVHATGDDKPILMAQRDGDWTYVAWEAPHARAPKGRLWVSDGRGLRSFLPEPVPAK